LKTILFYLFLLIVTVSCNRADQAIYFGGEIINPNSKLVLLLKDEVVIDTLHLDKNNRFFKKYDTLKPGLYTFKHEPEFQYIFFDKKDSLLVRLNTQNFDESLTYSGTGEAKNNFLIELFLKLQEDRNLTFESVDLEIDNFLLSLSKREKAISQFYNKRKNHIKWSDDFDFYAKGMKDLYFYSLKEFYPMAHQVRTNHNLFDELPKDYFSFRKQIDFNHASYTHFPPFMRYLTNYMSNVAQSESGKFQNEDDFLLRKHILKLQITDTLFKNNETKAKIFSNVAYAYLTEDQDEENNKKFITTYKTLTKGDVVDDDILKIGQNIVNLSKGNVLPTVCLHNAARTTVSSEVFKNKSLIFFWTTKFSAHQTKTFEKILAWHKAHPNYQIIAINLDISKDIWFQELKNLNSNQIIHFHACDREEIQEKWVVLKLQKTILLDNSGHIEHAFINMYDPKFDHYFK
jgi:peroxiredoxin